MTATYDAALASKQFQNNFVIQIGSEFFSQEQVDSDSGDIMGTGSGVPAEHVGTVGPVKLNRLRIDIRSIVNTRQSLAFQLVDLDEEITIELAASATQLMDVEVVFYHGFINGSFDFADYEVISRVRTKELKHESNVYEFTAAEVTDQMNRDIFTTFDILDGSINATDTTLTLDDATNFPSSGIVKIDDEFILYSGKSGNDLTGLSRGTESSVADSHDDDAQVFLTIDSGAINPITLLLQMMISPGGGGTYDVLTDGMGIDESDVDVTSFETIRDTSFSGRLVRLLLFDVGNGLKFVQQELMGVTRTRVVPSGGKIKLVEVDQVDLAATVPLIDESSVVGTPKWSVKSDTIVNEIVVKSDFVYGTSEFARTRTFVDSDSKALFPNQKSLTYEFKGVSDGNGGAAFVNQFASRLLSRLATPPVEISVRTHQDKLGLSIGDNVRLEHRYVPKQGGTLGISDVVQIMSKGVNFRNALCDYTLQYTSFSGFRFGLIAPSKFFKSVTSQSVADIEAGTGECYQVGDKVLLWNASSNAFESDPVNEITDITGDTITFASAWSTTLLVDVHKLKHADYNDATASQRARYNYIVDGTTEVFDDGSKGYQIIA